MELNEQEVLAEANDLDDDWLTDDMLAKIADNLNQQINASSTTDAGVLPLVDTLDDDEDFEVNPIPIPVVPQPAVRLLNTKALDPNLARIIRMMQVVGKFAGTLTLRPIGVEVVPTPPSGWGQKTQAPAWSDSDNIWFDHNSIGDLTDAENITSLKGLSLHEIAHILLTPRAGSNLAKDVQKAKLWRAMNALEDQRIEMMMTKRFGNVADWLTGTIAKHLVSEPDQYSLAFPLLHGRKYLPQSLRDAVYHAYEKPDTRADIADVIDQYIVLNLADPKNYKTAFDLIQRYAKLLDMLDPEQRSWDGEVRGVDRLKDPNGHQHRKGGEWKASKSKPMSKAEQDKLAGRVGADVAKQPGLPADQTGEGDQPSNGNDDGDKQGGGTGTSAEISAVHDAAKQVLDDVLKRKAKEIAIIAKQYGGDGELSGNNKGATAPALPWSENQPVSADAIQSSRAFAKELANLRADYDPGWRRNVESGRLSVERYSRGAEIDECFDEWDMGREDAVDIEAVLLLDISASMHENLRGAYESMWAIKRALDKTGASTTVIGFSHESFTIYSASDRAGSGMKFSTYSGGTAPLKSLLVTQNILADSKRAIKLCITITDGAWSEAKECDNIIRQLRKGGVLTALAFVENKGWNDTTTGIDTHGCEIAVNVTDTAALFTLGRAMVKAGVSRNLSE